MADNSDDEHIDNTANSQSEDTLDKIPITKDTDANSSIQEPQNMEVHHHPDLHHKPKKWKEYLLEGLMIFIAVTMGFFAEGYHMHLVNKEIEKRNIESFISNIQRDSANLITNINRCQDKIKMIDSLNKLPGNFTDTSFQKQFFKYAVSLTYSESYQPDESAFLQMQSSGTLRLIKSQNITDSILKYQSQNILIKNQQEVVNRYFNSALDNLFQVTDFRQTSLRLNENNQQIHNFINYKIAESISSENYIYILRQQLLIATNLIPFLKKQYDIEE